MLSKRPAVLAPFANSQTDNQAISRLLLLSLGLVGIALVLVSTGRSGIFYSSDSIHYIAASKSLLAGEGYLRYSHHIAFSSWPPLYPTVLAGLSLLTRWMGLDIMEAARLFHAVVFGGVLVLSGLLILRYLRSRVFALLALTAAIFSLPLLTPALYLLSELLYILISLAFILLLPTFLREKKTSQFAVLFVLALLAVLQRFAGIGLVPAGMLAIVLLMQAAPLRRRLVYALVLGFSSLPYLIWLVHGLVFLPRPAVRAQIMPLESLRHNLLETGPLLAEWSLPPFLRDVIPAFLLTLLVAAVIVAVIAAYYRRGSRQADLRTTPVLVALYVAVYMVTYYVANAVINTTQIDQRHLSVIYVFVLLLFFYALQELAAWLRRRWTWSYPVVVIAAGIWLLLPVTTQVQAVANYAQRCCQMAEQRQLEMVDWLKANGGQLQGLIYSNTPIPLFFTPLASYAAPVTFEDWALVPLHPDRDTYLIWFKDVGRYGGMPRYFYNTDYSVDDLKTVARVELIAKTAEGSVFQLRSRQTQ